jgi:hypothetical protein
MNRAEPVVGLTILRVLVFLIGVVIVAGTLFSATQTFVLPRSASDWVARRVFLAVRRLFNLLIHGARSYYARDRVMALYAPISLLALDATWLTLVMIGYMGMYWALGAQTWRAAFSLSGSSLLTLGFAAMSGLLATALTFSEAMIGLTLVALLIAYLPTIYTAFSRREAAVTMLEVRAGSPPSAIEMILRYHRIHGLGRLTALWPTWEAWFVDIDETHTSLGVLSFFRSPNPDRCWVTAAGAVLDAAALLASTVDVPRDPQVDLCIRAGFLALRHIAGFFKIPFNADPHFPANPISVTREEFDAACDRMANAGVALKADRDQAWADFAGWRVNYDGVLLVLASLVMAPEAPWSSDRLPRRRRSVWRPKATETAAGKAASSR